MKQKSEKYCYCYDTPLLFLLLPPAAGRQSYCHHLTKQLHRQADKTETQREKYENRQTHVALSIWNSSHNINTLLLHYCNYIYHIPPHIKSAYLFVHSYQGSPSPSLLCTPLCSLWPPLAGSVAIGMDNFCDSWPDNDNDNKGQLDYKDADKAMAIFVMWAWKHISSSKWGPQLTNVRLQGSQLRFELLPLVLDTATEATHNTTDRQTSHRPDIRQHMIVISAPTGPDTDRDTDRETVRQ